MLALTAAPGHAAATELRIAVDFNAHAVGTTVKRPRLTGRGAARTASGVVTRKGGEAVIGRNPTSRRGRALRLPSYQPKDGGSTPRAVLRLRNSTATDALAVARRDFRFGADFRLFADLGDDPTDGDNLVQRGLWGESAQWKLSVDGRKAQCMLGFGERQVATPVIRIPDGRWHRAACRRISTGSQQAELVLIVRRWNGEQFEWFSGVTAEENAWGRLAFDRDTPMSVGGKLLDDGSPHPSTDQFNGLIDRVRLQLG